jgi:hypothetical protein
MFNCLLMCFDVRTDTFGTQKIERILLFFYCNRALNLILMFCNLRQNIIENRINTLIFLNKDK